jgi:serine/threonine protein kinase
MHPRAASVESILADAVEIAAPADRQAFVAAACGGDADLRRRVEKLVADHFRAGSFLERPAAVPEPAALPPPADVIGTRVGPYKLLQQIGEGGMGTVYMARQTEPVTRLVALKLIKPGMDSAAVLARFEAERQALALMDHPNIAKVLDAGTADTGRPYFVMELVKGVPLTRFCDEHRLTPRQRLDLFVPVCPAVQHAHQKGIIHRDLKPGNILVALYDGKPVPKVIDFGVAKAMGPQLTEHTLVTGFGAVVGTPEYMSPEQAELNQLDIDKRSDIYALGVLLYELLAGSPPFTRQELEKAGMLEMLRVIREREPPKPSTRLSTAEGLPTLAANRGTEPAKLTRLVRGELDWIVMKALEKDRNRRYEMANGLAMDVERYLHDQPVQACPPSAWYRFRKFARRNKGILASVGLVALALVIGTVVSVWQAIQATGARNATRDQLRLTQQAEDSATQRLYRALVAQARASRLSRRIGQRFEALEALTEAVKIARGMSLPRTDFLNLRNETIACLALPDLRVAKEWDGFPDGSLNVHFADSLERYARVDRQGAVSVRRVADDTEICHLGGMGPGESSIVLSPDGNFLAHARASQLELWNVSGAEPVRPLAGPTAAFGFSPDILHAAFTLFGELSLAVMWKDTTGLPEAELADLGFRKVAGSDLIFRHSALRTPFGDRFPKGRDADAVAQPEYEAWVEREWNRIDGPEGEP